MKKQSVVYRDTIQFDVATLCRLMDDCLPDDETTDELGMQDLINKLWPALVCEHEVDNSEGTSA